MLHKTRGRLSDLLFCGAYEALVEFTVNALVHRSLSWMAPIRIFILDNSWNRYSTCHEGKAGCDI